jgi:acyl-homoserine-lactone acylase
MRHTRLTVLAAVLATTLATALVPASASETFAVPGSGAVIRRTSHGIPHILASDFRGLGYGAGYAYAEDNLCLLAEQIVTVSGERSRWFRPDWFGSAGQLNLDSDFYHRQVNESGLVGRLLARPAPLGPSGDARDLMRGYAAGYNAYLSRTGVANLPDPTCRGAGWVRPISELDLWRRAYAFVQAGARLTSAIATAAPPGAARPATADGGSVAALMPPPESRGSNAIALGQAATLAGSGMVLANSHEPWYGGTRWYQHHLTIPGVLDVSGGTIAGVPVVVHGHNDRLGWASTASAAPTATISRLRLVPGNPTSYLVDGRVRHMTRQRVTVRWRTDGGRPAHETRTLYRTPDGPVLQEPGFLDWSETTAYVLHDANADNVRALDQLLAIDQARSVGDLHAALSRIQGLPSGHVLAADASGTAYYANIQVVPHVTDALRERCEVAPSEPELIVLDGSRSACAWGSDPDAVRPGLFGPSRLPTLTRTDFVANSNESPWLTNPAALLTGYPTVLGDIETPRELRTRLGLTMIQERIPDFTLSTMQEMILNNRSLSAELGRDPVVAMCQAEPVLVASDGQPVDVRQACDTLSGWDLRGDLDSRGALLWQTFFDAADDVGARLWTTPFDPAHPVTTPNGLDTDRPEVRTALADAVQQLTGAGIPLDAAIRDVQRYHGIPIHGCSEGCYNIVHLGADPSRIDPDDPPTEFELEIAGGTSFLMVAELTPAGPRTRTIMTHSQSTNPASPYYSDQTRLYSDKQWLTVPFTPAEIAADPNLTVRVLP